MDKTLKISLIAVSGIAIISLLVVSLVLNSKNTALKSQFLQSKQMIQNLQKEISSAQEIKEKMNKEKEGLQADTVMYMSLTTKLQQEKEKLEKNLKDAQKVIDGKAASLERTESMLKKLQDKVSGKETDKEKKLIRTREKLRKDIAVLEGKIRTDGAASNYNLGVALALAEMYNEAIEAYKRSLEFKEDNADAHYNLGVLYENIKNEPGAAAAHYTRYIELNPDASDRDEIETQIKKLRGEGA